MLKKQLNKHHDSPVGTGWWVAIGWWPIGGKPGWIAAPGGGPPWWGGGAPWWGDGPPWWGGPPECIPGCGGPWCGPDPGACPWPCAAAAAAAAAAACCSICCLAFISAYLSCSMWNAWRSVRSCCRWSSSWENERIHLFSSTGFKKAIWRKVETFVDLFVVKYGVLFLFMFAHLY